MTFSARIVGIVVGVFFCGQLLAQENMALGKKYTLSPQPNYVHCTDPDDTVQLTDGKTTTEYFWTQKGTVGWQHVPYASIQIDLEKVEPIHGIEITTAAGTAGVTLPQAVFVHVSDDGKTYRNAGDIITADLKANGPFPDKYSIRCLAAKDLENRGRFVRIVMLSSGAFLFTDEIRIFRGSDTLLQGEPSGEVVPASIDAFYKQVQIEQAILLRVIRDIFGVRGLLTETPGMTTEKRAELSRRIDTAEQTIHRLAEEHAFRNLPDFKTIFPYNEPHAELFRVQAEIWKNAGTMFRAEAVPTWGVTPLFGLPEALSQREKEQEEPTYRFNVHALRGEYRAAAVNLYNGTQQPITANLRINGLTFAPEELTIHDVPWTDTKGLEPVLAALPVVEPHNGVYPITILPGLVKQVWLTFHPVKLSAGDYKVNIVIESDAKQLAAVPLSFKIWQLELPKQPSLLLGGWSYTDGNGAYSVNPKNRASFLKHLQERFVNAPWARPSVVMNFSIDKTTNSVTLNTKEMDDWLAQWQNAKEYCIFLHVGADISGIKYDAPEFEVAAAAWITAWTEHWKSKGIEPQRINLLVADEPGLGFDLAPMFSWCRAIKKAQPKLKLWIDPLYADPSNAPKEVFELNDVICPNRPQWLEHRQAFDSFYFDLREKGKTLQLYSCSGPVRLLDPYSYFRLQAWECARIGGTGSFFWAFGDGGGWSSWNEYLAAGNMYTPLFIDPDSEIVVAGKQMEAIRESVEDFETIQMLKHLIERRKVEGKSTAEAEVVLKESLDAVFSASGADRSFWKDTKDRTIADQVRFRIIETILKFDGHVP